MNIVELLEISQKYEGESTKIDGRIKKPKLEIYLLLGNSIGYEALCYSLSKEGKKFIKQNNETLNFLNEIEKERNKKHIQLRKDYSKSSYVHTDNI